MVGIPHRQGSLKPLDVTGAVVVPGMGAVAADTGAPAILEAVVWLDIPGEDPRLKHGPGLAVGRPGGETGNDADDGGTVKGGDALPQDAAVRVDGHGVAAGEAPRLIDPYKFSEPGAACCIG